MFSRILALFLFLYAQSLMGQVTTCPAPAAGQPNCYQTSRPLVNNNPLTRHPPIPNQDCCNAIPLCNALNTIDNGVLIPPNGPAGILYPGCVQDELPSDANTCFSNNEKATTWYKFKIQPLPGGPTAVGSPGGKLRFRIIPNDVLDDPDYDPFNDDGATGYGETDYDFLLFKIPASVNTDGGACTAIRNSTTFTNPTSVIASCNWTGTRGPTGLFEPGTGTEFALGPATRFNRPLSVKVGDVFYLAIDNFSVNVQGFSIDFTGLEEGDSTANVVAPLGEPPAIVGTQHLNCSRSVIELAFSDYVVCDSIKPSRFTVSGQSPNVTLLSIVPVNGCITGLDSVFRFTFQTTPQDTLLRLTPEGLRAGFCTPPVAATPRFIPLWKASDSARIVRTGNTLQAFPSNALSYQWLLNNQAIPGANQPTYTIAENGNYAVIVRSPRCTDTSITQNLIVSVSNRAASGHIRVYPNPARGVVYAEGENIQNLEMLDPLGRVLTAQRPNRTGRERVAFPIADLPSGLYFFRVTTGTEQSLIRLEVMR